MTDLEGIAGALPAAVEEGLKRFVERARAALGDALVAVVLHGSAAEGRLRATSDVNLIVVVRRFERERIDGLRAELRAARAAFGATAMFLRQDEVAEAAEAFAEKFADVARRRRVLLGEDPFAALAVPREALARRLRQVGLNQVLRMRERYATVSLREEDLARALADAAGPLRSMAASLLDLQGRPAPSPREALARVVAEAEVPGGAAALDALSRAREEEPLAAGEAGAAYLALLAAAERIRERAAGLERAP